TGTHDNDTALGWFRTLTPEERRRAVLYLHNTGRTIHWDMIRVVLASVADTVIVPLQDVLGLGTTARMNLPGTAQHNWRWRVQPRQIHARRSDRLRTLTHTYVRYKQPLRGETTSRHTAPASAHTVQSQAAGAGSP